MFSIFLKNKLFFLLIIFICFLFNLNLFALEPQHLSAPLNKYILSEYLYELQNKTNPKDNKKYMLSDRNFIHIESIDNNETIFTVLNKKKSSKINSIKTNYTKTVINSSTNEVSQENITYTPAEAGIKYSVENKYISNTNFTFYSGIVYSFLVVPFKIRMGIKDDTDRKLQPSSTIGGAIGYRSMLFEDIYNSFIGFFGYSIIPTSDIDNETVETKNGISYGLGYIIDLPKLVNIQLGIVAGMDWANDFNYNGDLWISFAVGYKFMSI